MIYDFSNRKINIDSSHKCPLECPKCQRQAIRRTGHPVPGQDKPWDDFIKIANYFEKGLLFCGQISDPTANPLLINMLKYCYKKINVTLFIYIWIQIYLSPPISRTYFIR